MSIRVNHYVNMAGVIPESIVTKPALDLLRMGFTTLEIAAAKGCSEASDYNWIHRSREADRFSISRHQVSR